MEEQLDVIRTLLQEIGEQMDDSELYYQWGLGYNDVIDWD